jgi:hypothetical protein
MPMERNRHYLAHGFEHAVFKIDNHPRQTVIKKPSALTVFALQQYNGIQTVRDEIQAAEKLVAGTVIQLPKTKVIGFNSGIYYGARLYRRR